MKLKDLLEESISKTKITFISLIAKEANSSKPTTKTINEIGNNTVRFTTSLKNADEHKAGPYLKKIGFTEKNMKGSQGSSRGDFSSDQYGSIWTHKDIEVKIYSNFKPSTPTFNIELSGNDSVIENFVNTLKESEL